MNRDQCEEMFRRLAVSYHWEYDADYPAEREEILETWTNLVPTALRCGMTEKEIAGIFKKEEHDALIARRRRYTYEQEYPYNEFY